jgi:hypothetical protein
MENDTPKSIPPNQLKRLEYLFRMKKFLQTLEELEKEPEKNSDLIEAIKKEIQKGIRENK